MSTELPMVLAPAFASFDSSVFAAPERESAVRQAWSNLLDLDAHPFGAEPASFALTARQTPDLSITRISGTRTAFGKSPRQADASPDQIVLCVAHGAGVKVRSAGGAMHDFPDGSMHVWRADRPMTGAVDNAYSAVMFTLPRGSVDGAGIDLDPIVARGGIDVPHAEFSLLARSAELVLLSFERFAGATQALSLAHLTDLALLALQRAPGARLSETATRRGRLAALKRDIVENLADPALSPEWLARRHGISTRYLRDLFAGADTHFSAYVLEQRLVLARRLLSVPEAGGQRIGAIAWRCGFSDLSYFNRSFRRRFCMTPTDARRAALS